MEFKIREFLEKNSIIIDKPIICAVSGGVDSVVLINVLHKLGYNVILAHVNHHKRAQSELEEKAMRDLALSLNIPFELLAYYYDGNDNFHNDSHNARYNFFRGLCKKYNTNIIATAHHLDDQIETILMKLMEGSNLYGYGGISICNDDGEYKIIRPLLCLSKEDLYSYAKENSLVYFEDSSNFENDFLRNRMRHFVVPLLKKECSDLPSKCLEYSIQLKEAFQYIRKDSIKYLSEHENKIEVKSFNELDIALRKDIVSLLLENNNIRKNNNIILDIVEMLKDSSGQKSMDLEGYRLIRSYNEAYLKPYSKSELRPMSLGYKDIITYGKYMMYFSPNKPQNGEKYIKLCYNKLVFPLCVRPKEDGDFITTLIGTKKLSRVFIDNKIPKDERCNYPVILNGDNKTLWVYDLIKSKEAYEMKEAGDTYLIIKEK